MANADAAKLWGPGSMPPAELHVPAGASEDRRGDIGYHEHSIAKKGRKIEIFVKVMEIDTGIKLDKSKTIGTISTKNGEKVLMTAHSGYSTGEKSSNYCLDTAKWNSLTLHHLAKQIDFKFPTNIRDAARQRISDEHRGRAHAGHVEVLLACWYVVEVLRTEFEYHNKTEEWLITQLKHLKKVNLGDRRTAFITIDSEPCRTCLLFLYKLSQHTEIIFEVRGPRGIGPIQVRVEGQRRQDVVCEAFLDSDDDVEDINPNETVIELQNAAPYDDLTLEPPTTAPEPPTPVTPRPPSRPRSSWKPIPWTPLDPQELLSSYKKKTPEYEFPGYERARNPSPVEGGEEVMAGIINDCDSDGWEDIGDDIMMYCTSAVPNDSEGASIKCEEQEQQQPPCSPPRGMQNYAASNISASSVIGEEFAASAYGAMEETRELDVMEYEVVEQPREKSGDPRPSRRHRLSRQANSSARTSHIARLQQYRHEHIDDTNESVFKSRYAILRPKYRFHDPRRLGKLDSTGSSKPPSHDRPSDQASGPKQ